MPRSIDPPFDPEDASYGSFQGLIDTRLMKANADVSIPWAKTPIPDWARTFRPKRIIDLGCAEAHFTCAILTRLGEWGCLSQVEDVTLVESDTSFQYEGTPHSRANASIDRAIERCRRILDANGRPASHVTFLNQTVRVATQVSRACLVTEAGQELSADLLVMSHVIYYFPVLKDRLMTAALNTVGDSQGYLWMVVRNRDCPIYQERERWMRRTGKRDIHASDFSDSIRHCLRHLGRAYNVHDTRDLGYLTPQRLSIDDRTLIHALMWRGDGQRKLSAESRETFARLAKYREPLFSERHFIIGA